MAYGLTAAARRKLRARRPQPRYAALLASGELRARADGAFELYRSCGVCPRTCAVQRLEGEAGICRLTGATIPVGSFCDHRGEEPPISGTRGSGTIFIGSCNLRCVFCQNWQISQPKFVEAMAPLTAEEIGERMLGLQASGVHNINFVSPAHVVPHVVRAIAWAAENGLTIPIVYNTNGYDSPASLALLDGLVDVYLPDLKYADDAHAFRFSKVEKYWEHATVAVREMYRQVGALRLDDDGFALGGLIVRHLVMPGGIAGTRRVLEFIARELSSDVTVSLMAQFNPLHKAAFYPEISRKLTAAEYAQAVAWLAEFGLNDAAFIQELDAPENYTPDFDAAGHPFERERINPVA